MFYMFQLERRVFKVIPEYFGQSITVGQDHFVGVDVLDRLVRDLRNIYGNRRRYEQEVGRRVGGEIPCGGGRSIALVRAMRKTRKQVALYS